MNVKDKALRWWAEKTKKGIYVVSGKEISSLNQRNVLTREKFLYPIIKGYWILKRPEDEVEEVIPLLYWQIVEKLLSRLSHWSIRSRSALAILNGDENAQKHLLIRTKEKTNRKVSLPTELEISLLYDPDFDERLVKHTVVAGREIAIDVPEKVLIETSRFAQIEGIQSFIAGTQFDLRLLEAIYAGNPKPIVFKRLIRMAKEVSRFDLVSGLEKIIETHTYYQPSRKERVAPELLAKKPVIAPPWVIRQERQIQDFEETLEKHLATEISKIKTQSLDKLLSQAREHKRYDTYHSTTLEGYRITPEEVDALLSGLVPKSKKKKGTKYLEEIKNRMAILGYSEAFDFIIKKVQEDFKKPQVTEDLIKDTYYHLFKPSADAEIIDYLSLVSYRKMPAFIRGTRYVPPSHEKLTELMAHFVSSANQIQNPIIKAILTHYFFVTIHPYSDGNGRTARLLMNYLLLITGYSWITIRADQRDEYFEALRKGQLEGDILPFGKFIVEMIHKVN